MGEHSGAYHSCDPNKSVDEVEDEALRAWTLLKRGWSYDEIAAELGVSRRTVANRLRPRTPRRANPGRPWRSDVGYIRAHQRVRRAKGRAHEHLCRECGGPATEWAYTNDDPAELVDDQGRRYSLDPDRYVPMCYPCHRRLDAARRRGAS